MSREGSICRDSEITECNNDYPDYLTISSAHTCVEMETLKKSTPNSSPALTQASTQASRQAPPTQASPTETKRRLLVRLYYFAIISLGFAIWLLVLGRRVIDRNTFIFVDDCNGISKGSEALYLNLNYLYIRGVNHDDCLFLDWTYRQCPVTYATFLNYTKICDITNVDKFMERSMPDCTPIYVGATLLGISLIICTVNKAVAQQM